MRARPPFRADHVGSLLRPAPLVDARARHRRGELADGGLQAVEDECIREAVRRQEALGLESITDGEFRRGFYHLDFLSRLEGVDLTRDAFEVRFRGRRRSFDFSVPEPAVTGKLRRKSSLAAAEFRFLREVATRTAKICIPAPSTLHFRGGRQAVDRDAYPRMEDFFADLVRIYLEELKELYSLGCRYVQFDDPNICFLCDPAQRDRVRGLGEDPDTLPGLYAELIRDSIGGRPSDMAVSVHLCRGNFSASGAARGGYDSIAAAVFGGTGADGLFLEFDDERSGNFEPLRHVPKTGPVVVLGLISTKRPELESREALTARMAQAARYLDIDRLAISPQCGFSSTHYGNDLSEAEQFAKLALAVEVSREVWGREN